MRYQKFYKMKNIFTKHPNSVGESYLKHFGKALQFSVLLLSLSLKALVHAILPFCYETAVSDKIKSLSEGMQKRRKQAENKKKN